MAETKIEYVDATWNPVTGCAKISPGCKNCYAERMAYRLKAMGQEKYRHGFDVTCHPKALDKIPGGSGKVIFVCSMGDLFHHAVPASFIGHVFLAIKRAPQHRFLILTKRPEPMLQFTTALYREPLPNLALGVTVESPEYLSRIDTLLDCPAAMRFVSVEPMLDSLRLQPWLQYLDWVICGCESGPKRRPMRPHWVQSLRDSCDYENTPFFLKQMEIDGKLVKMPKLDGRVHDDRPVWFGEQTT